MGTEILSLQHELEEAKNSLKDVDEHLKKLIGRDPSELPPRIAKRPVFVEKNRSSTATNFSSHGRGFSFENDEPPIKRRTSVFNRLSDKVVHTPQKGLISKVIVTPKEIPSREEALQAQNKDEKFKARNRRMFGALLGTLQKFQQEETKLKPKEEKRAQLEKKIEEHEIKEKEEIKKERQELFMNRKKKRFEIKIIELKMLRMKEYNAWEESQKPRKNFILTKSKPSIHYLPCKLNDKTKELLATSKADIEKLIETKKKQVNEELQHIEERIKRNFDNKIMKFDNNEVGDQDVHETDEQFEDVLTESQIAVASVNNKTDADGCDQQVPAIKEKPSEENLINDSGVTQKIVEGKTLNNDNSCEDLCGSQENVSLSETSVEVIDSSQVSEEVRVNSSVTQNEIQPS